MNNYKAEIKEQKIQINKVNGEKKKKMSFSFFFQKKAKILALKNYQKKSCIDEQNILYKQSLITKYDDIQEIKKEIVSFLWVNQKKKDDCQNMEKKYIPNESH